jgi:hypothetical protein
MVGFSLSVNAQNGFWYGASVGIQNTFLSSKNSSEIDVKNAYRPTSTLDIEYRFNPKLSIQSGLGYALYTQNTSKFKNNFNYLVVPLYIKGGKFKENKKYALSTFFGFNYKILLSACNIYEGQKNDISEFTRNSHIDYTIGFGLKYKLQDNILLESHLTGAYGGNFNNASFDGFILTNFNYGVVFSLKYNLSNKKNK